MYIASDKEKLLKSLKKLETQFTEGKVSKRQYGLEKRVLEDKLDTVLAADRIKKLQGKGSNEKSLDFWSDQKKEEEDVEEKEALIEKYVTTPAAVSTANRTKSSGMSRGKLALIIFFVAAFFVGTGYGVYVMSMPSDDSIGAIMNVNDSAFPLINNTTNVTKNTTKNTTKVVVKRNVTSNTTVKTNNSTI
jgi:hypothetical protein